MRQLASIGCAELRFAPVPRRGIISTERSELMNTFIKKHKVNNRKTYIILFPVPRTLDLHFERRKDIPNFALIGEAYC
jgi:hypothetical protein